MNYKSAADRYTAVRNTAQLFDIAGQSVIATAEDGTILYWSYGAVELYGWSQTEAIGRNVVDVTPSEQSRDQAVEIMASLTEGRVWTGRFPVRRRDGSEFIAAVRDVPVMDEHGKLIGIVGISTPS